MPLGDPSFERVRDIHDVIAEMRDEIEHFFQRYKDLEPSKRTDTRGWGNRAEAAVILEAARVRAGLPRRRAARRRVRRPRRAAPSARPGRTVVDEQMRMHRVRDPLRAGIAEPRSEPAADHDGVEVEEIERRADAGAERATARSISRVASASFFTSASSQTPLVSRSRFFSFIRSKRFVFTPFSSRAPRAALHCPAARIRLEAAAPAARTRRAVQPDDDVPELTGRAETEPQLPVDHDRAADSRSPPDAEERPIGLARAEHALRLDSSAHVVAHGDAGADTLRERSRKWKRVLPAGKVARRAQPFPPRGRPRPASRRRHPRAATARPARPRPRRRARRQARGRHRAARRRAASRGARSR